MIQVTKIAEEQLTISHGKSNSSFFNFSDLSQTLVAAAARVFPAHTLESGFLPSQNFQHSHRGT
jgi:hypothetical protein